MPSATAQPSAGGEKQKTLAEMDQPWDHAVFQKPPTGAARWGTCQKWIYRTHPKARVGLFHPLHSSYPPEAGELSGQRVSIVFYDGKAAERGSTWTTGIRHPTKHSRRWPKPRESGRASHSSRKNWKRMALTLAPTKLSMHQMAAALLTIRHLWVRTAHWLMMGLSL